MKKTLAVLLVLALALSASACGGADGAVDYSDVDNWACLETVAEAAADVFGSDGGLELRRDGLTYIHELDGKIASERLFSGSGEPNEAEHEFIVHKLLAGDRSCEAANQALAVCKAVEALYASAASGKPVCF